MTLEDYKKEKLSLDEFAIWKPITHVFDMFKCSKCGYEEAGIYQYVISGHKVWQYPTTCPDCERNMIGVEKEFKKE